MSSNLKWAEYINIFDCLDLSCYYATDSHWKQDKLQNVVNKITNKGSSYLNPLIKYVIDKIKKGIYNNFIVVLTAINVY